MAMPKKGKFVTVDGVKTHYYEKGRGKTVVLVHGGNFGSAESSGNSWTWSRNFDYFARKFHVVAVDKLGQGYTGNPKRDADYTMHAVVQHLGAFLRKLNLANTHLVGHSRGGYVTARLTLEQPDLVESCTCVDSNTLGPGVCEIQDEVPAFFLWRIDKYYGISKKIDFTPTSTDRMYGFDITVK